MPQAGFAGRGVFSLSKGKYSAPKDLRRAIENSGASKYVTEVCRKQNASYGARNSLHKKCMAIDISRTAPKSVLQSMKNNGWCPR